MIKELIQLIKWLFQGSPKKCDKLEIVQMKYFPFSGYLAMSWCGKLITKRSPDSINSVTINHETTHLKQAQQYGSWIAFYLKYGLEWLKGKPLNKPYNAAYYTIPFEIEAYANENNPYYNDDYNSDNLKNKYSFKDRREKFISFNNIYEWEKYIRGL